MTLLYANRWQATKVRLLTWGFLVGAFAALYWAADVAQTYGLTPGDGGVLRPPWQRGAMASLIAVLGLIPIVGMVIYCGRYITRLEREGNVLDVTLIGFPFPRRRRVPIQDFAVGAAHAGRLHLEQIVNAPWLQVRIAGRSHILDLQAEEIDHEAIVAAANQAAPAPAAPAATTQKRKRRIRK